CGEDAEEGHLTGSALEAVIPHLVDVAGSAGGRRGDERLTAELCSAAGQVLHHAGDLGAARPWYERALAIPEQVLGPDHPDTAAGLNDLGALLWNQGELTAARPLLERGVTTYERALGPDHPLTAQVLEHLGGVLMDQGDLDKAKPLLKRALTIMERTLGT